MKFLDPILSEVFALSGFLVIEPAAAVSVAAAVGVDVASVVGSSSPPHAATPIESAANAAASA